jgi:hypothetical protein
VSLPSAVATFVGAAPAFMPRFFGFVSRSLIGPAPASMLAASPHLARHPGKTMTKTHRTRRALAAALALCCGAAAAHDDARECTTLISMPLKELLEQLDPQMFWQVHRSTIVNVQEIESVGRDATGYMVLRLKHRGESLRVSQPFAYRFRQM